MALKRPTGTSGKDWRTCDLGDPEWVIVDQSGKRWGAHNFEGATGLILAGGAGGKDDRDRSRVKKVMSHPLTGVAVVAISILAAAGIAYAAMVKERKDAGKAPMTQEDVELFFKTQIKENATEKAIETGLNKISATDPSDSSTSETASETTNETASEVVANNIAEGIAVGEIEYSGANLHQPELAGPVAIDQGNTTFPREMRVENKEVVSAAPRQSAAKSESVGVAKKTGAIGTFTEAEPYGFNSNTGSPGSAGSFAGLRMAVFLGGDPIRTALAEVADTGGSGGSSMFPPTVDPDPASNAEF